MHPICCPIYENKEFKLGTGCAPGTLPSHLIIRIAKDTVQSLDPVTRYNVGDRLSDEMAAYSGVHPIPHWQEPDVACVHLRKKSRDGGQE